MKRTLSIISLSVALGLGSLASTSAMAHDVKPVPAVTASDRVLGRADAPVTVIEYASFTCSHCANFHNTILPELKSKYIDTGKVRLVFRDMPTQPVQIASIAAGIARCSAPNRFFDVAKSLMSGQAAAFASGNAGDWFTDAIGVSGKSQAEIEACIALPETSASLNRMVEDAIAAGVTGTPSFFVNSQRVADYSLQTLSAEIDRQLRAR